ncbi:MAG TPA: twitching motility protein PilT, partial [Sedimenticola thiotaurini]|nr:twitching motility protein PilT [Sedimenticola thiotaurini]
MAVATLRFYEELNDFLPPQRRKREIRLEFEPPAPARHLIETLGVPHTEVEVLLRNGESVGLETPVRDGDRLAVYPLFESLDVTPLLRIRPRPLRRPRFLADAHLGRLAGYLRMLGFDTRLAEEGEDDRELVQRALEEGRILLTRDRALLMRREVTHGCFIHPQAPRQQLAYLIRRLDLCRLIAPFTRCIRCNGVLEPV